MRSIEPSRPPVQRGVRVRKRMVSVCMVGSGFRFKDRPFPPQCQPLPPYQVGAGGRRCGVVTKRILMRLSLGRRSGDFWRVDLSDELLDFFVAEGVGLEFAFEVILVGFEVEVAVSAEVEEYGT